MAELLGAIQRGLGTALSSIYDVTGSYAVAIILLTIVVRALLIPLTVKQIRSMTAMQKLAPEQKKVQQKYKQLQQKAKDRVEVQQLRLQMNQELQGLFREHGVNPLGGCLPLIAQMPVFIAMFSIMRASIIAIPATATLASGGAIAAGTLPTGTDARQVICRPVDAAGNFKQPQPTGGAPTEIKCLGPGESDLGRYRIGEFYEGKGGSGPVLADAAWISSCGLTKDPQLPFACQSATGSGHLPRAGRLFADVTRDRAKLLGMRPGCSATQVQSKDKIRTCTSGESDAGGAQAIPYYLLIGLIVGTSYYQAKQMFARATGPAVQQQKLMMRIMPVMFGFISLSIPAGANLYFLATNVWTIGQQHILLKKKDAAAAGERPAREKLPPATKATVQDEEAPKGRVQPSSRKKRKRKKR